MGGRITYDIALNQEDKLHWHVFRYVNNQHDPKFYCFINGVSARSTRDTARRISAALNAAVNGRTSNNKRIKRGTKRTHAKRTS